MKFDFYIVDVFADGKYSGNPLAVVINHANLTKETMQEIATEMNFSETTFVQPIPDNGCYAVRIFTPSKELDFAGHPILGTAYVIRQKLLSNSENTVELKLSKNNISVTFEEDSKKEIVWFDAPPISLGETLDKNQVAHALEIDSSDIDAGFPIQLASAGTSAIIVPLRNLDALQRCSLNLEKYAPLKEKGFPPLVYLFSSETRNSENDFSVRFFFEAHGVREDPATGNGAAFFGKYILSHNIPTTNSIIKIEQGFEVNRPSLVMLQATSNHDMHEIRVGGYVVPIVQGNLL